MKEGILGGNITSAPSMGHQTRPHEIKGIPSVFYIFHSAKWFNPAPCRPPIVGGCGVCCVGTPCSGVSHVGGLCRGGGVLSGGFRSSGRGLESLSSLTAFILYTGDRGALRGGGLARNPLVREEPHSPTRSIPSQVVKVCAGPTGCFRMNLKGIFPAGDWLCE